MEGLIKGALGTVLKITGLGKIYAEFDKEPWMGVVFALTVILSLLWMFRGRIEWLGLREPGKIAATFGKFPGGIAVAFIIMAVGMGLAVGIATMLVHWGVNSIISGVGSIWLIGPPIAKLLRWLAGMLLNIVIMIAMGIFILKSLQSLFSTIWGAFTGAAKDYADPKAPHGVKMVYQICGSLVMAILLCNPIWNRGLWFAPAIASSLFGVYSFFTSVGAGRKAASRVRMRVVDGPDPETGDWLCPNKGKEWVRDREGRKVPDPKRPGQFKVRWITCGQLNHRTQPFCISITCDYPNPDWILKCEGCGFEGEDKQGFRRQKRDQPQKCPKCGHRHAPPPEWIGWHHPDQDKYNAGTPGAVASVAQSAANTPPSAAPTPITLVMLDMPLEVACTKCGKPYDAGHGYKGCPNCGQPFAAQNRMVKQPLNPSVTTTPSANEGNRLLAQRYAEKRARTRKPWKRKFSA